MEEPKKPRIILMAGGCGCVGLSMERVMSMHHLHEKVEIINVGTVEIIPEEDSIEAVIAHYEMIRPPELVMKLEDLCFEADDSNCSMDGIKKDNAKFYDHYYKGKRR